MNILLAIIATAIADWTLGFLLNYNKKKQLKRDEDLFTFKLEQILSNKSVIFDTRIENAKDLCRGTEGKLASGAYAALHALK